MKKLLLPLLLLVPMLLSAQGSTPRTVLIERFTGTWCQWCPYGSDSVMAILARTPNARELAYHKSDAMSTAEGDAIMGNLLVGGYPTAAVDRILWNVGGQGQIALDRNIWGAAVNVRRTTASPLSLNIAGSYWEDTRYMELNISVMPLRNLPGEYYLNVVLTEDSLNYDQKKYMLPSGPIVTLSPYYHDRTVRKMVTGAYGVTLTTTQLDSLQAVAKQVTYTIPSTWNARNVRIAVFVTTKVMLTVNGTPTPVNMAVQNAWMEQLYGGINVWVPVELVAFSADQAGDAVALSWMTTAETNNRGWDVERRTVTPDGLPGDNWQRVGFVNGTGTTAERQTYTLTDRDVRPATTYDYRLKQLDFDGTTSYSSIARVLVTPIPTATMLHQNYPNPFNPATSITVELASDQRVSLQVFDGLGRLVRTLADGTLPAGGHVFDWDGTDASGSAVPSGIYYCRLTGTGISQTRTMQLMK